MEKLLIDAIVKCIREHLEGDSINNTKAVTLGPIHKDPPTYILTKNIPSHTKMFHPIYPGLD